MQKYDIVHDLEGVAVWVAGAPVKSIGSRVRSDTLTGPATRAGAAVKISELTDGSQLYETDRGAMRVTRLGSGCTNHVCIGHLTVDLAQVVTADGDELLATHDRVVFLVDCYDVRHLDTAFREHMTAWFKTHRRRRVTGHMLVRSKVIELAANVANMLSGTRFAQAYSNIAQWQDACQREYAGFRRQPLVWRPPSANAAS